MVQARLGLGRGRDDVAALLVGPISALLCCVARPLPLQLRYQPRSSSQVGAKALDAPDVAAWWWVAVENRRIVRPKRTAS
ncbi:hypothetical protein UK12_33550 [Saccharothrix sp. ST-888]|nr:hypothetical protein UK12_33550 [Saccharothrix sp. ST-888]